MRVAAVIAATGDEVAQIANGPFIRILDTETGETREVVNPAWGLERDRRPTAARALAEQHVDVIVTPPGSFCTPSHAIARRAGMRFWPVPARARWSDIWQAHRYPPAYEVIERLPRHQLVRQDVASMAHYARLYLRDFQARRAASARNDASTQDRPQVEPSQPPVGV